MSRRSLPGCSNRRPVVDNNRRRMIRVFVRVHPADKEDKVSPAVPAVDAGAVAAVVAHLRRRINSP